MLVSQSVSSAFTCMGTVFWNTDSNHCIMDLTFDQFPHLSTTSVIMAYGIQSYFVLGMQFSIFFGSNRTSRPGRDTGKWLPVIPLPPLLKPNQRRFYHHNCSSKLSNLGTVYCAFYLNEQKVNYMGDSRTLSSN